MKQPPGPTPERSLVTRLEVLNWIAFKSMVNVHLIGDEASEGHADRRQARDDAVQDLFEAMASGKIELAPSPTNVPGYDEVENPSWGAIDQLAHVEDSVILFRWVTKHPQWFRRNDVLRLWSEHPRRRTENTQHDWSAARQALLHRFEEDGVPDWKTQRGEKARYERWLSEQFPVDRVPAASQLRSLIDEVEKAYFANLDRRK